MQTTQEHGQGLAALAMMPSSATMHGTILDILSSGGTILQILQAIYAHKDDFIAAYNALVLILAALKPAPTPTPQP